MKTQQQKQKGFTLVEIAIVLVIIGLLLGGVLKGQELIRGAKIKAAAQEVKEWSAAYYGYIDRYGKKPGDDDTQASRWSDMTNGDNDGSIEHNICDSDTDESCLAMRALMHAGFIKGDGTDGQPKPQMKLGGKAHLYSATYYSQKGIWLRSEGNTPKELLAELDRKIDDGKCNSGVMVSTTTNNSYCDQTTGEYKKDYHYVVKID